MGPEVGDRAPSFALTRDDSRTTVRLAELEAGPVVLLFFPSPIRPRARSRCAPWPKTTPPTDFNKEAAEAYGVLRESLGELSGVSERAVFVLDRDRTVACRWVGEHPGKFPPLDEIKDALRRLL